MLGDLLLELHQPKPALVAYAAALKEALAASLSGRCGARVTRHWQSGEGRFYYAALVKLQPITTRKELWEAKLFLSGN